MDTEGLRSVWLQDESTLAAIGAALAARQTEVEIRLPPPLADAAVQAWQREDDGDAQLDDESCEQRIERHRAGSLALIGSAIDDRGRADGDDVVVRLDAWFVGDALNAADDRGLIGP